MQRELEAKFCALIVADQESNQVELRAYTQIEDDLIDYKAIFDGDIPKRAVNLQDLSIWNTKDLIKNRVIDSLQVATIPLKIDKEPVGALLIGRIKRFDLDDKRVIDSAKVMIDSAIIQCRDYRLLQDKIKELQTIYKIDRIRDRALPFNKMLELVLEELKSSLSSEVGFIMLYNHSGKKLELKAITDSKDYSKIIEEISYLAIKKESLIHKDRVDRGIRSILALPLILNDRIIGVIGVINPDKKELFTESDKSLLKAIGSQIDTAIFEDIQKRRLKSILERSVDPKIMDKILRDSSSDILLGEKLNITLLFADLRGFSSFSEDIEAEVLVKFINEFYERMTEVIFKFNGTLDKFIGDEVMALFGAPLHYPNHQKRAIECAVAMQKEYKKLKSRWDLDRLPGLGIGIATGEVIAGEMGSSKRSHYTVIGKVVNLTSRVCSVSKDKEILISSETYKEVKEEFNCLFLGRYQLKGINQKFKLYKIDY
jgi:adenylate cyclase